MMTPTQPVCAGGTGSNCSRLTPTHESMTPTHIWVVLITPWSTLLPFCSRFAVIVSIGNQNAGQAYGLTCINVVGDTGIEPVTSTVSMKLKVRFAWSDCRLGAAQSFPKVRLSPRAYSAVVMQFVMHPGGK